MGDECPGYDRVATLICVLLEEYLDSYRPGGWTQFHDRLSIGFGLEVRRSA